MMTLMHITWLLTVVTNVTLSLLLFIRGLYIKFSWLFITCALAVFSDYVLHSIKTTNPHLHMIWRDNVFFFFIPLQVGIIWEAWKRGKKWLQIPMEILLALQVIEMPLKYNFGRCLAVYDLDNFIGFLNLAITIFLIYKFDKEPMYE